LVFFSAAFAISAVKQRRKIKMLPHATELFSNRQFTYMEAHCNIFFKKSADNGNKAFFGGKTDYFGQKNPSSNAKKDPRQLSVSSHATAYLLTASKIDILSNTAEGDKHG